jgi:hypothetical protein
VKESNETEKTVFGSFIAHAIYNDIKKLSQHGYMIRRLMFLKRRPRRSNITNYQVTSNKNPFKNEMTNER